MRVSQVISPLFTSLVFPLGLIVMAPFGLQAEQCDNTACTLEFACDFETGEPLDLQGEFLSPEIGFCYYYKKTNCLAYLVRTLSGRDTEMTSKAVSLTSENRRLRKRIRSLRRKLKR